MHVSALSASSAHLVSGPIVYINLAGQDVVVLNTLKVAADLLDRRSSIYSSRPRFEVACNMLTEGMFFVFQGYTDRYVGSARV